MQIKLKVKEAAQLAFHYTHIIYCRRRYAKQRTNTVFKKVHVKHDRYSAKEITFIVRL